MKKQSKIIIGVVVAVAILIVGISFFFPAVFKGISSGTFGKADKYHKAQMSEKDILLRSELVKDTVELQHLIQGLIYFSLFTQDLSSQIDSCTAIYRDKGVCETREKCESVSALEEYSDFIKNNNKTLSSTISMLTGFYLKDKSDESQDVENNMRAFGNYVNNLTDRDSVINQALATMDNFLMTNKTIRAKKEEIASLKSIRDQLLIRGLQLSALLDDKPLCATLCGAALSSELTLSLQEVLGSALTNEAQQSLKNIDAVGLQSLIVGSQITVNSADQLRDLMVLQISSSVVKSKQDIGSASLSVIVVGSVILYNSESMQFIAGTPSQLSKICSAADLNSAFQAAGGALGNIQAVGLFSAGQLCLVQAAVDMNNAVSTIGSEGNLNGAQIGRVAPLNVALQNQNYGSYCVQALELCSSPQLGVTTDR